MSKKHFAGMRFEWLLALLVGATAIGSAFAALYGLQSYVSGSVWFHAIVIGALIQPNLNLIIGKASSKRHSLRLLTGFLLVLAWGIFSVVVLQQMITASVAGFLLPRYITVANGTLLIFEYGLYSYPIIRQRNDA
jgi:large-conductance mechanosensitive channel